MKLSNLRTTYQGMKHAGLILLMCAVSASASAHPHPKKSPSASSPTLQVAAVGTGCQVETDPATAALQMQTLMDNAPDLLDPPEYDFTGDDSAGPSPSKKAMLNAEYKELELAGCKVNLRQWVGADVGVPHDRPVGPTMRIEPGHTYQAQITNKLPRMKSIPEHLRHGEGHRMHQGGGHGGASSLLGYIPPKQTDISHNLSLPADANEIDPAIFNTVNIHTHGWHVDPTGNSDNIFREMLPGVKKSYNQTVYLPTYHPSGSFWYHSHVHGSTTIQVASGMAGALIVVDPDKGLDAIPAIQNVAADRIMVFQQLAYGTDGRIENYDFLHQGGNANLPGDGYKSLNRPVFINGQAYPKVAIKKGEVQRWRFIHAGMTDAINPQLVRVNKDTGEVIAIIRMHEIALDGFPTGDMPAIPYAVLASGYRTDVLVKIPAATRSLEPNEAFWLIDQKQKEKETVCIAKCGGDNTDDVIVKNFRRVLAQIEITGTAPTAELPSSEQISQALADYQQGDPYASGEQNFSLLNPINLNEEPDKSKVGPTQTVHYIASNPTGNGGKGVNLYECPPEGGECIYCEVQDSQVCGGEQVFMYCDGADQSHSDRWRCYNFNSGAEYARSLNLNTASEWKISGSSGNHIFHIHVNPFQVQRKQIYGDEFEYDGNVSKDDWVWKDTLIAPQNKGGPNPGSDPIMKSRYTRFTGAFVQHCHVLHHEDRGMMQTVSVSDPTFKHIKRVAPELYKAIMQHGKAK